MATLPGVLTESVPASSAGRAPTAERHAIPGTYFPTSPGAPPSVGPGSRDSHARTGIINAFLTGARRVLVTETGGPVERRGLSVLPNVTLLDQVTIGVSVVGQVRGVVMLGMSSETARQIVSVMAGKPESELSEMGLSALAELGNSAVGHAVLLLEGMGLSADITPPTISLGGNSHVTTFGLPSFVMPLSTQQGSVNLHVAVDLPPGQGSSR